MEERIYRVGERIGTYEVLSHLGTGGETALYSAINRSPDAERTYPVALKVCRYEARTLPRDAVARFNDRLGREYRLLVALWHRNVVRVLEQQTHEGLAFYVLELLEGPTLGRWWAAERRTFDELMRVYRQLAWGLAYVHRRGLVHRDLKPSNVLVERQRVAPADGVDWGGPTEPEDADALRFLSHAKAHAVLIDFSVTQTLTSAPLTLPGTLVGTAEYLSPEYARAALERSRAPYRAAPCEDVYQMGVLLYLLLTGQHPVRTPAGQLWEVLEEIRDVTPPSPTEVNPDAPAALSALCRICLAKDGHARPQDGAALLRRLVQALREDAASLEKLAPLPASRAETALAERTTERVEPVPRAEPRAPVVEARPRGWGRRLLMLGAFALVCVGLGMVLALGAVARELVARAERGAVAAQKADGNTAPPKITIDAPAVATALVAGLPMPGEPRSSWVRCPKDCGYGEYDACRWQGHPQVSWIGYRGTCWIGYKRDDPDTKGLCARGSAFYDAPADAPEELRALCFLPAERPPGKPNVLKPRPPR